MNAKYFKEKNYAQKNGLCVKNGCLDEITAVKKAKYDITDDINISKKTILSRIRRGNLIIILKFLFYI